jgi:hypothetical protein
MFRLYISPSVGPDGTPTPAFPPRRGCFATNLVYTWTFTSSTNFDPEDRGSMYLRNVDCSDARDTKNQGFKVALEYPLTRLYDVKSQKTAIWAFTYRGTFFVNLRVP